MEQAPARFPRARRCRRDLRSIANRADRGSSVKEPAQRRQDGQLLLYNHVAALDAVPDRIGVVMHVRFTHAQARDAVRKIETLDCPAEVQVQIARDEIIAQN